MSAPLFLVDECLPAEVTTAFRDAGFDVADIVERGQRGLKDEAIWLLAASEGRVLVTRNLDFPLRTTGKRPPGLILVRAPDDATAPQLGALIASLLRALEARTLVGQITVVSPGRYRQRPISP